MKPSLLIMAAGMGSRYGGLKQMEGLGPSGETLLDYSVYDAIKAGFGKVVFVIRHDIEDDFKKIVGKKWESKIPVRYVFQELGMVPEGFRVPAVRQKPWGTGHAIWVAQKAVQEPFAAINADDYYGQKSFKVLADYLLKIKNREKADYCMVGFQLKNTLSKNGTVSRGVCETTSTGYLKNVAECLTIGKNGKRIWNREENGTISPLRGTATVSMNMWGFTPLLFTQLGEKFKRFLKDRGHEEKSEFLIPRVVDELLHEKKAKVKILSSKDQWFGVTYPEDKKIVRASVQKLVFRKVYPANLWG